MEREVLGAPIGLLTEALRQTALKQLGRQLLCLGAGRGEMCGHRECAHMRLCL